MNNESETKLNKFVHILTWIFFVPFSIGIVLILGASFLTTIYYDLYQEADLPRFGKENIPLLILLSIVVLGILLCVWKRAKVSISSTKVQQTLVSGRRVSSVYLKTALLFAGFICLYLVVSVRGLPTSDAYMLNDVINAFMEGDYSSLDPGGYLFVYPFQIGYVAIGQLFYVVFGANNFVIYQLLNIVSILFTIWILYYITWELFENRVICELMAMLSFGMFFLFMYADFVYSDIWSIAPEMGALYLTIRFLKYRKIRDILLAGVFNGFAIVLKSNAYIATVAMVIILILDGIRNLNTVNIKNSQKVIIKRIFKRLAVIVTIIFIAKGMQFALNISYARASGLSEMPNGVPSTTYFAMAMHEGDGEGGWYNGYNVETYSSCGYDWNKTNETAIAEVQDRLEDFVVRPLHACRFYYRKFLSQWSDPTCISMRNLELTSRHVEDQPGIVKSLIYGDGRTIISWIMNVFQFICYLGVLIYCIGVYKNRKIAFEQAFIVLFILGGMAFHEIWEGSSRYIIRYYVCMIPFASFGINQIFKKYFSAQSY